MPLRLLPCESPLPPALVTTKSSMRLAACVARSRSFSVPCLGVLTNFRFLLLGSIRTCAPCADSTELKGVMRACVWLARARADAVCTLPPLRTASYIPHGPVVHARN